MEHTFGSLDTLHLLFLILALALALGFEFVNGFHDTANAVATVIYTNSLPPWLAVIWSGIWNFLGVLSSTGAVAFGIISLLPAELVMNVGSGAGFAMVFSMLISAIIWNVGTWYLGLPASSSHALIGSIMGVGLMNSLMRTGSAAGGINWTKAQDVGLALLVSPVVGFVLTALLFLLTKAMLRKPELYAAPPPGKAPPLWVRGILCLTCTGVSYAHGSNDGQKGMGLLMLILVGVVPGMFALNLSTSQTSLAQLTTLSQSASAIITKHTDGIPMEKAAAATTLANYLKAGGTYSDGVFAALSEKNVEISLILAGRNSLTAVPQSQRGDLRGAIYLTSETIGKLKKSHKFADSEAGSLTQYETALDKMTKYIPVWVKALVALALGLGTMVGWKRIVVTVGERSARLT
jgi:PiT family inorganic phosphate transporter